MRALLPTRRVVRIAVAAGCLLGVVVLLALLPMLESGDSPAKALQPGGGLPQPVATQKAQGPTADTPAAWTAPRGSRLTPEPTPTYPPGVTIVSRADYGVWSYAVARTAENTLQGVVRHGHASVADLNAYAAANQQLCRQLPGGSGPIPVTITFRDYVAPDTFRAWVTAVGLQVDSTALRGVETIGTRDSMWVDAATGDPLPDRQLRPLIESPARPRTVKGIISTTGTADAAALAKLAEDPLVYLVDCTEATIRGQLAQQGIAGAAEAQILVESPFWDMEDFGLQNFK